MFFLRDMAASRLLGWLMAGLLGVLAQTAALAQIDPPNWQLDPSAFAHTMSLTATVTVEGEAATGANDTLAVFYLGEVRGLATPNEVNGETRYFLTIYGQAEGEAVSFKLYSPTRDSIYALNASLVFQRDAVVGSIAAPVALGDGSAAPTNPNHWQVDPGAFSQTMNVVAALYIDGHRTVGENDVVAAFIGNEVRGVAAPTLFEGQALFLMTLYGEVSGSTVTFQVYDAAKEAVQPIRQRITFVPNTLVGSLANPTIWQAGASGGSEDLSDWVVDPGQFSKSMNMVAALYLDDARSTNPNDTLAAFVAGEIRGRAAPVTHDGEQLFLITLYGEVSGAPVHFKVYDAAEGVVRTLKQTISFTPDGVRGSLSSPYTLSASLSFDPGWTVNPDDFSKSMTIIGAVVLDGDVTTDGERQIAAFVGDEVRGVAELLNDAAGKRSAAGAAAQTFVMNVYANTDGEALNFRVFDPILGDSETQETGAFVENSIVGSASAPQTWSISSPPLVRVSVRVLLEGAFDGAANMTTHLRAGRRLPQNQPYSTADYTDTPLAYAGAETVTPLPNTSVDWVLLELRTGTEAASVVAHRAALLLASGQVVDVDGASPVRFEGVEAGAYYVVVRHRNHLAVMTAAPLALGLEATEYDFTSSLAQAFGSNAMQELASGVFGLFGGDGNASGIATASDQALWLQQNGFNGYLSGDFNLSGGVTASDQALWLRNNGRSSQVPDE